MSVSPPRLPAAERRQAIVEAALQTFSNGSYRGATTSEIARRAGISEPILYRHFASKRQLYLACVDEAWRRLCDTWRTVLAEEEPGSWLHSMGSSFMELKQAKVLLSNFWMQALTEASDDEEIRRYMRRHLREVHDFVEEAIRTAQRSGHIRPERDPAAEAWIFIAVGLLGSIGRRLGGLAREDFPRIIASRREWMTGVGPDA